MMDAGAAVQSAFRRNDSEYHVIKVAARAFRRLERQAGSKNYIY
jgi:hypothetical protein